MKKTTGQFIMDANKVHNNKYIYDKVNYINAKTKIIIICNEHGEFEQTPNVHLNGSGCKKCYTLLTIKYNDNINEKLKGLLF